MSILDRSPSTKSSPSTQEKLERAAISPGFGKLKFDDDQEVSTERLTIKPTEIVKTEENTIDVAKKRDIEGNLPNPPLWMHVSRECPMFDGYFVYSDDEY